jgi:hypothetical protein
MPLAWAYSLESGAMEVSTLAWLSTALGAARWGLWPEIDAGGLSLVIELPELRHLSADLVVQAQGEDLSRAVAEDLSCVGRRDVVVVTLAASAAWSVLSSAAAGSASSLADSRGLAQLLPGLRLAGVAGRGCGGRLRRFRTRLRAGRDQAGAGRGLRSLRVLTDFGRLFGLLFLDELLAIDGDAEDFLLRCNPDAIDGSRRILIGEARRGSGGRSDRRSSSTLCLVR